MAQRRAVAAAIASMAGVLADLGDRSPDGPWKILLLPQSVRETAEWCGWLTFTAAWLDSALLSPPPRLRPLRRRWVHGLRARVPGILEALCASRGGREAFLTEWVEFSLASDVLRS